MTRKVTLAAAVLAAFTIGGATAQDNSEDLLARGAYLMNGIVACGNCHTPSGAEGPDFSREMAGGLPFEEAEFTAYASNITSDPETGIGGWTEEEVVLAIREGIRPDGSVIGPPMPILDYRHMSDRDAAALAAYLAQVPAVEHAVPASTYHIPLPPAYGPPLGEVTAPDPDDQVAYGGYLARDRPLL